MELSGEHFLKITAHPGVYIRHPFLVPMESAARNVHAQLGTLKADCTACKKQAFHKAAYYLANAFIALMVQENRKTPNDLGRLKETLQLLLQTKEDFVIKFQSTDHVEHELKL